MAEALTQVQLNSVRNTGLQQSQRAALALIAVGITAVGAGFAYTYPRDFTGWTMLILGLLLSAMTLRSVWRKR